MSDRRIDALEETVSDIDKFIQSELGFDPLSVTEPFTAAEIHSLSSILETRGTSTESFFPYALGKHTLKCIVFCLLIIWSILLVVPSEAFLQVVN